MTDAHKPALPALPGTQPAAFSPDVVKTTDEAEILERLNWRKRHRRQTKAAYRKLRDQPEPVDDVDDTQE